MHRHPRHHIFKRRRSTSTDTDQNPFFIHNLPFRSFWSTATLLIRYKTWLQSEKFRHQQHMRSEQCLHTQCCRRRLPDWNSAVSRSGQDHFHSQREARISSWLDRETTMVDEQWSDAASKLKPSGLVTVSLHRGPRVTRWEMRHVTSGSTTFGGNSLDS